MFRKLMFIVGLLLVGLISTYVFHERDYLFEWEWTEPHGAFSWEEDVVLKTSAMSLISSRQPKGYACVNRWIGRDAKYLYMAVGCARFSLRGEKVHTVGDGNLYATRFEYEGQRAIDFEQPDLEALPNALKRLFPKVAADKLISLMKGHVIFHQEGRRLSGIAANR